MEQKGYWESLAYWIYYEDGSVYYCKNCIDKRLDEINSRREFSEYIDYEDEDGDTCGYFVDYADEREPCYCSMCGIEVASLAEFEDEAGKCFLQKN